MAEIKVSVKGIGESDLEKAANEAIARAQIEEQKPDGSKVLKIKRKAILEIAVPILNDIYNRQFDDGGNRPSPNPDLKKNIIDYLVSHLGYKRPNEDGFMEKVVYNGEG